MSSVLGDKDQMSKALSPRGTVDRKKLVDSKIKIERRLSSGSEEGVRLAVREASFIVAERKGPSNQEGEEEELDAENGSPLPVSAFESKPVHGKGY